MPTLVEEEAYSFLGAEEEEEEDVTMVALIPAVAHTMQDQDQDHREASQDIWRRQRIDLPQESIGLLHSLPIVLTTPRLRVSISPAVVLVFLLLLLLLLMRTLVTTLQLSSCSLVTKGTSHFQVAL